jgi:hypothetical protein
VITHDKCEPYEKVLALKERKIKELEERLEEAEEVIHFYADTTNWDEVVLECGSGVVKIVAEDVYSPWQDVGIDVGGLKAKNYVHKYAEDL